MKLDILYNRSCQRMLELPDESIDLMATDPPYGLKFMGQKWDKALPSIEIWKECLRVIKPGAFAFIMCIPRQDCLARMIISLEKAGFIISVSPIFHTFASGFPKAMNIARAIEKRKGIKNKKLIATKKGNKRYDRGTTYSTETHTGFRNIAPLIDKQAQAFNGSYSGFSPKPSIEIVLVAMKPLSEKSYIDQALKNKKGITWLDNGRIPVQKGDEPHGGYGDEVIGFGPFDNKGGVKWKISPTANQGRFPANLLASNNVLSNGKITKSRPHGGNGKPLDTRGMGWGFKRLPCSINDSGSFSRYFSLDAWFEKKFKELPKRIQRTFPFLIVPKASRSEKDEGCEKLYWEKDSSSFGYHQIDKQRWIWLGKEEERIYRGTGKRVSLKAKGNIHSTVKPLKLFSYLIILGSREGDVILDPFFGSGTTGIAARMLSRHYIGYEMGKENVKIARARLSTIESMLL